MLPRLGGKRQRLAHREASAGVALPSNDSLITSKLVLRLLSEWSWGTLSVAKDMNCKIRCCQAFELHYCSIVLSVTAPIQSGFSLRF
jgi:hypothetical protein